ncbi:MAG: nicotinate (nicotinamide) nucleotide adenylyltransferase, partial [Bacilli bacterium]|nr:nicotinate (nicotinamide) nucleotide adenylyltransferase [Bacilli bacterium]
MKKVILFGGTFDPIHNGHLAIADTALKQLDADNVIFVLARAPRWKQPNVETKDRLEMLKLAIQDNPSFTFSTYEIDNEEEVNYSYNTALHFVNESKNKNEEIKYYWLIGEDQVDQLDKWYEIDKLSSIVQFVYYGRGKKVPV